MAKDRAPLGDRRYAANRADAADQVEPRHSPGVAADQLRLFIERIERLEEEKKALSDDIGDVYSEAKANGYDTKVMRMVIRLRRMEAHTRQEQDAILETYRSALAV